MREKALFENKDLTRGLNLFKGRLTCKGVAEAHGLCYTPVEEILGELPKINRENE